MFVIPSYYDGSISNVHDTIQSIQKFEEATFVLYFTYSYGLRWCSRDTFCRKNEKFPHV